MINALTRNARFVARPMARSARMGFSTSALRMNKIVPVLTKDAPQPVGPYSQAVKSNGFVYLSGQIPLTPEGKLVESTDIQVLTHQIFANLKGVLAASGSSLNQVVKVNVFVTDISQFGKINEVYAQYFSEHKPARSLVAVSALPLGVPIEIEAIALHD